MKSYFNTLKKPKYVKLCGDGDVIDGPIDVIQDQNLTLEQKRQQGIDAYNTANSAFERARDLYRSIDRNDFDSRSAYKAAKSEAKVGLETARADRVVASKEFGGDEAAAAVRKAKVSEVFNAEATMGQSIAANAAVVGVNAIDKLAMGDKNFGAQSEAIDGAVHAASGALMKSGNPYLMAAGAALEGANFLTKAGGQTVQGFDVDIASSGYGNLGHMESSSSRDFGAMIGLGGIFGQDKLKAKLARRNEKLKQALVAADIAEEQSFQQEARANSIDNVIENNKIALNGGLSTSVLAAKSGGRLDRLKHFKKVVKAENGAKLKKVEVSEEASVIPEGALHKNKHNLELDGITAKGIPVITVDNDADTFTEIKQQEDTIVIHAEVEKEEVIFSKELTDFVENKRKEWHDSNSNDILEEVGKRVTKELLFNTNDNADLIKTLRE